MYEQTASEKSALGPYEGPPFREGDTDGVVRWFAAGWDGPRSGERFVAHFAPGMDEDVRLIQPAAPTVVGHKAFRALFSPLLDLVPDLRADVHRWAGAGDAVFIEFTLSGTIGGRRVRWPVVDRLTMRDGLVLERRSFFDPAALRLAVMRHPRSWPRAARMVAGSLRRR